MSGTRNYIPMRCPALFPRQTFRLQTSGTDGFEPSRPSLRPGRSQLLAHSVNPDSRVSKVFNVSCLPRVVSGARPPIYLLQGGAYCLYDRIDSNDTCRKLHPLFNLQIPPESVSVKDTYPRKEESMKKCLCQVAATTYESSL